MIGKLSARQAATFKGPGKLGDGGGLWVRVTPAGGRFWFLRYRFQGRYREMGLGSADDVGLREAREGAARARRLIREGLDPIAARRQQRAKEAIPTFAACAERFLSDNEGAWNNATHRAQWRSTLDAFVLPSFGNRQVDTIGVDDVLKVLQPLWQSTPETASRVRGRIERVLDWARARGYRTGENPAKWSGHLDKLLPKRSKPNHFASMDWQSVPTFMGELRERQSVPARCLEFGILTVARSGQVRGMRWSEVDGSTWTIPGTRMKAGRQHRVPLSARAASVLDEMRRFGCEPSQLVFPGSRPGRPLSDITIGAAVLRHMGRAGLTVHGFRSSFRNWCSEETDFSREVIEASLAHVVADKTEAAYFRSDVFEKRRRLMDDWARYCERIGGAGRLPGVRH